MRVLFKYEGSRPDFVTTERELDETQLSYLRDCETRGVKEFVVPIDRMLVKIERQPGRYLLRGRDIEIAP